MSIKVGDTVKLIDKFYEHEAFRSANRWIRKQIASLTGKELEVKHFLPYSNRIATGKIDYSIPVELLEKVEELPKPGDLFRVVGNMGVTHCFKPGDIIEFTGHSETQPFFGLCGLFDKTGIKQWVHFIDLEPCAKHRYTDEQIAEAEQIIGKIVADMAWQYQITFALIDGNIIVLYWKDRYENMHKVFEAKCSPSDEYNETIGKMVCLCRAARRKLPDWIYV